MGLFLYMRIIENFLAPAANLQASSDSIEEINLEAVKAKKG